jgi:hypothetical protein
MLLMTLILKRGSIGLSHSSNGQLMLFVVQMSHFTFQKKIHLRNMPVLALGGKKGQLSKNLEMSSCLSAASTSEENRAWMYTFPDSLFSFRKWECLYRDGRVYQDTLISNNTWPTVASTLPTLPTQFP